MSSRIYNLAKLLNFNDRILTSEKIQDFSFSDMKQIWHTESYNGGSNYVGFGNANTDKIIEDLRITVDDAARFELYKELQAKIHEEIPYVFLIARKNTVCTSKKYDGANATGLRSGLYVNAMKGVAVVDPG